MERPRFAPEAARPTVRTAPGHHAELTLAPPLGTPPFTYTWSREGATLGDRFVSSEDAGGVKLTVKTAQNGDSGVYTLQATNAHGSDLARVRLQVSPEEEGEGDDPPTFLRRLQDLSVKVGTRTRFLVEIVSSTECRVTWYRNERRLLEAERIALVKDGNFWCADVAAVSVDDAGRWTCTAENAGGRSSCSAHLNVIVPKAYKSPVFLEELRALLTERGTVSLECKVVGVPTPTLRWFKDSKEIKAGDVFALTASADDPTSLGTYTCEAVNCMGRSYSSSKVHVMGRGSREGSRPSSSMSSEPPPIFTKELEDQHVKISDPLNLSCHIVVPPWPRSVVWYNKEGKIDPSERYSVLEDGVGGYLLEVTSADWADEGEWKCVATGSGGRVGITTAHVTMDVPKNYRKPRFMENLQAILTEEGLVSFECKVVGFPTPVLSWFKDGQELKPGDVYQLTGTNSLGSYCCIARNCMGQASSSAELTIDDIQNQLNEEEKLQLFAKNQAPKFITGLKSVEVKIDEPYKFVVKVVIPPEPSVVWYRDEQPVEECARWHLGRDDTTPGGATFHLQIQTLEFLDQAEWKCVATNEYGHSITSCFLKLIIPRHYKKPRFLENLQAILSEEGAVNLECKVIGVPQPTLKWYKDGEELKPGDIHKIISGQDGTCCLGTYTCEAQNCMGIASSSASLLGFEDSMKVKNTKKVEPPPLHKNLSLSTIHEERTSQMYDTPAGDITYDDKGEISFSFDGKEVSVSLYETPDLTEEEALQIVEMYADQLSENVTEHNVVELPPLRFVKETSTSGNLLMEAVIVDVSPGYFITPEEDLRTEADIEDMSIADENGVPQLSLDLDVGGEDYLEKTMAMLTQEKTELPKKTPRRKSDSQKSVDDYYSLSQDHTLSEGPKDDETQLISESEMQSYASAKSSARHKSKASKISAEDEQPSPDLTVLLKENAHNEPQISQPEIQLTKPKRERRTSRSSRRSSSGSEKSFNKFKIEEVNVASLDKTNEPPFSEQNVSTKLIEISKTLAMVLNDIHTIEKDVISRSESMSSAAAASRSLEIISDLILSITEIKLVTDTLNHSIIAIKGQASALFDGLCKSLKGLQQSLIMIEKCIEIESDTKTLVQKTCASFIDVCSKDLQSAISEIDIVTRSYHVVLDDATVTEITMVTKEIISVLKLASGSLKAKTLIKEAIEISEPVSVDVKHLKDIQRVLFELKTPLHSLVYLADCAESGKLRQSSILNNSEIVFCDVLELIKELQKYTEQYEILLTKEGDSELLKPYYAILELLKQTAISITNCVGDLVMDPSSNAIPKFGASIRNHVNKIEMQIDLIETEVGVLDILNSENKLDVLQKIAQILIALENNLTLLNDKQNLKQNMAIFHKNLTKVLENVIESNETKKYYNITEICAYINIINTRLRNLASNEMINLEKIYNTLIIIREQFISNIFETELNCEIITTISEVMISIEEMTNQGLITDLDVASERVDDVLSDSIHHSKCREVIEHIEHFVANVEQIKLLEISKDLQESFIPTIESLCPSLQELKATIASSLVSDIVVDETSKDLQAHSFSEKYASTLCELNNNILVLSHVVEENLNHIKPDTQVCDHFAESLRELLTALEVVQQDVVSQLGDDLSSYKLNENIASVAQNIKSCLLLIQDYQGVEGTDDMSTLEDISAFKTTAEILSVSQGDFVQEFQPEVLEGQFAFEDTTITRALVLMNHKIKLLFQVGTISNLKALSHMREYSQLANISSELEELCEVQNEYLDYYRIDQIPEKSKLKIYKKLTSLVQLMQRVHDKLTNIHTSENMQPLLEGLLDFNAHLEYCINILRGSIEITDEELEITLKIEEIRNFCLVMREILCTMETVDTQKSNMLSTILDNIDGILNASDVSTVIHVDDLKTLLPMFYSNLIHMQENLVEYSNKTAEEDLTKQAKIIEYMLKNCKVIQGLEQLHFVDLASFASTQNTSKVSYELYSHLIATAAERIMTNLKGEDTSENAQRELIKSFINRSIIIEHLLVNVPTTHKTLTMSYNTFISMRKCFENLQTLCQGISSDDGSDFKTFLEEANKFTIFINEKLQKDTAVKQDILYNEPMNKIYVFDRIIFENNLIDLISKKVSDMNHRVVDNSTDINNIITNLIVNLNESTQSDIGNTLINDLDSLKVDCIEIISTTEVNETTKKRISNIVNCIKDFEGIKCDSVGLNNIGIIKCLADITNQINTISQLEKTIASIDAKDEKSNVSEKLLVIEELETKIIDNLLKVRQTIDSETVSYDHVSEILTKAYDDTLILEKQNAQFSFSKNDSAINNLNSLEEILHSLQTEELTEPLTVNQSKQISSTISKIKAKVLCIRHENLKESISQNLQDLIAQTEEKCFIEHLPEINEILTTAREIFERSQPCVTKTTDVDSDKSLETEINATVDLKQSLSIVNNLLLESAQELVDVDIDKIQSIENTISQLNEHFDATIDLLTSILTETTKTDETQVSVADTCNLNATTIDDESKPASQQIASKETDHSANTETVEPNSLGSLIKHIEQYTSDAFRDSIEKMCENKLATTVMEDSINTATNLSKCLATLERVERGEPINIPVESAVNYLEGIQELHNAIGIVHSQLMENLTELEKLDNSELQQASSVLSNLESALVSAIASITTINSSKVTSSMQTASTDESMDLSAITMKLEVDETITELSGSKMQMPQESGVSLPENVLMTEPEPKSQKNNTDLLIQHIEQYTSNDVVQTFDQLCDVLSNEDVKESLAAAQKLHDSLKVSEVSGISESTDMPSPERAESQIKATQELQQALSVIHTQLVENTQQLDSVDADQMQKLVESITQLQSDLEAVTIVPDVLASAAPVEQTVVDEHTAVADIAKQSEEIENAVEISAEAVITPATADQTTPTVEETLALAPETQQSSADASLDLLIQHIEQYTSNDVVQTFDQLCDVLSNEDVKESLAAAQKLHDSLKVSEVSGISESTDMPSPERAESQIKATQELQQALSVIHTQLVENTQQLDSVDADQMQKLVESITQLQSDLEAVTLVPDVLASAAPVEQTVVDEHTAVADNAQPSEEIENAVEISAEAAITPATADQTTPTVEETLALAPETKQSSADASLDLLIQHIEQYTSNNVVQTFDQLCDVLSNEDVKESLAAAQKLHDSLKVSEVSGISESTDMPSPERAESQIKATQELQQALSVIHTQLVENTQELDSVDADQMQKLVESITQLQSDLEAVTLVPDVLASAAPVEQTVVDEHTAVADIAKPSEEIENAVEISAEAAITPATADQTTPTVEETLALAPETKQSSADASLDLLIQHIEQYTSNDVVQTFDQLCDVLSNEDVKESLAAAQKLHDSLKVSGVSGISESTDMPSPERAESQIKATQELQQALSVIHTQLVENTQQLDSVDADQMQKLVESITQLQSDLEAVTLVTDVLASAAPVEQTVVDEHTAVADIAKPSEEIENAVEISAEAVITPATADQTTPTVEETLALAPETKQSSADASLDLLIQHIEQYTSNDVVQTFDQLCDVLSNEDVKESLAAAQKLHDSLKVSEVSGISESTDMPSPERAESQIKATQELQQALSVIHTQLVENTQELDSVDADQMQKLVESITQLQSDLEAVTLVPDVLASAAPVEQTVVDEHTAVADIAQPSEEIENAVEISAEAAITPATADQTTPTVEETLALAPETKQSSADASLDLLIQHIEQYTSNDVVQTFDQLCDVLSNEDVKESLAAAQKLHDSLKVSEVSGISESTDMPSPERAESQIKATQELQQALSVIHTQLVENMQELDSVDADQMQKLVESITQLQSDLEAVTIVPDVLASAAPVEQTVVDEHTAVADIAKPSQEIENAVEISAEAVITPATADQTTPTVEETLALAPETKQSSADASLDLLIQHIEQYTSNVVVQTFDQLCDVLSNEDVKESLAAAQKLHDSLKVSEVSGISESTDMPSPERAESQIKATQELQQALSVIHTQLVENTQQLDSVDADQMQKLVESITQLQSDLEAVTLVPDVLASAAPVEQTVVDEHTAVADIAQPSEEIENAVEISAEAAITPATADQTTPTVEETLALAPETKQSSADASLDLLIQHIEQYTSNDVVQTFDQLCDVLSNEDVKESLAAAQKLHDSLKVSGVSGISESTDMPSPERAESQIKATQELQQALSVIHTQLVENTQQLDSVDADQMQKLVESITQLQSDLEAVTLVTDVLASAAPVEQTVVDEHTAVADIAKPSEEIENAVEISAEAVITPATADQTTPTVEETLALAPETKQSSADASLDLLIQHIEQYTSNDVVQTFDQLCDVLSNEDVKESLAAAQKLHDSLKVSEVSGISESTDMPSPERAESQIKATQELQQALSVIHTQLVENTQELDSVDADQMQKLVESITQLQSDLEAVTLVTDVLASAAPVEQTVVDEHTAVADIAKPSEEIEKIRETSTEAVFKTVFEEEKLLPAEAVEIVQTETLGSEINEDNKQSMDSLKSLLEDVNSIISSSEINCDNQLSDNLDDIQTVIIKLRRDFDNSSNEMVLEVLEDLECSVRSVQLQIDENSDQALLKEACAGLQLLASNLNVIQVVQEPVLEENKILTIQKDFSVISQETIQTLDRVIKQDISNNSEYEDFVGTLTGLKDTVKSLRQSYMGDVKNIIENGIEINQQLDEVEDNLYALEKTFNTLSNMNPEIKNSLITATQSVFVYVSNMRGLMTSVQRQYLYDNYGKPSEKILKAIRTFSELDKDSQKNAWNNISANLRKILSICGDIKFYINLDKTVRTPSSPQNLVVAIEELNANLSSINDEEFPLSNSELNIIHSFSQIVESIKCKPTLNVEEKIPIFIDIADNILTYSKLIDSKNKIKCGEIIEKTQGSEPIYNITSVEPTVKVTTPESIQQTVEDIKDQIEILDGEKPSCSKSLKKTAEAEVEREKKDGAEIEHKQKEEAECKETKEAEAKLKKQDQAEVTREKQDEAEVTHKTQEETEVERKNQEKAEAERKQKEEAESKNQEEAEVELTKKDITESEKIKEDECKNIEEAEAERRKQEQAETERKKQEQASAERQKQEQAEAERLKQEEAETERLQQEQAEAERLQQEQAEAERIKQEQAEAERIKQEEAEAERLKQEQAETERIKQDQAETERIKQEQAETERIKQEQAETERKKKEEAEAERKKQEEAETERLKQEQAEAERIKQEEAEAERLKQEEAEAERKKKEEAEAERKKQEEAGTERKKQEEAEAERLKQEQAEAERIKKEEVEAERKIQEQAEIERKKKEEAKAERQKQEQAEAERIKKEEAEAERQKQEQAEAERQKQKEAEAERLKQEQAERKMKEEAEAERQKQEQAEAERKKQEEDEHKKQEQAEIERKKKEEAETERKKQEKAEAERKKQAEAEAERIKKEEAQAELQKQEEAERKKQEQAEIERKKKEQAEAERQNQEQAEAERIKKEEAEAERKKQEEAERKKKEQAEAERQNQEQAEAERIKKEEAEAERKKQEEAERKKQEQAEIERKKKEEAETERKKQEKAEAERKKQEEAEAERQKHKEAEAERIKQEEAERKKQEEDEATRKKQEEAERKKQKQAEIERKKQAEAEAERKKQEEAETKRKKQSEAEAERKKQAEAEAERKKQEEAEAERKKQEEAEAERLKKKEAEAERKKQAEAEAERKKQAEAETERKKQEEAEAECKKREQAEAESKKNEEAERKKQAEAEAERKKLEEAETERKKQAEAEAERKKQAEAEAERKKREQAEAESKKNEEAERIKKEAAETERKKKEAAETERKKKEEAETERKKQEKAEAERKKQEEDEATRKKEEELKAARRKQEDAEAERKKQVEAEFQKKKEAEAERKKKDEAEAERKKKDDAEIVRKKQDEAESKKNEEAERKKKDNAEIERKKQEESEVERKKQEEAELKSKKQKEAEIERKQKEEAKVAFKKQEEAEAARKKQEEAEHKKKEAEAEAERKKQAEAEGKKQKDAKVKHQKVEKAQAAQENKDAKRKKQEETEVEPKKQETAEVDCMKPKQSELKKHQIDKTIADKEQKKIGIEENSSLQSQERAKREEPAVYEPRPDLDANVNAVKDTKENEIITKKYEYKIGKEATKRRERTTVVEDKRHVKNLRDSPTKTKFLCSDDIGQSTHYRSTSPQHRTRSTFVNRNHRDYTMEFARPTRYREKTIEDSEIPHPDSYSSKDVNKRSCNIYKAHSLLQQSQMRMSVPPEYYAHNAEHRDYIADAKRKSKALSEVRTIVSDKQSSLSRDTKRSPVFTTFLTDRTAVEGSRVKLTCSVLGSTDTKITWFKNGTVINDMLKYRTKFSDGLITLEVMNAVPSDTAEYRCSVENSNGSITTSANLKVYPSFEATPIPPTFTRSIRDTYHLSENELVLECRIRGQPRPSVSWYKENKLIECNDRFKSYYLADGDCRLVISSPTPDDSGNYTCKAESALWSDQIHHAVTFTGKESRLSPNIATVERTRFNRQGLESRRPHFANVFNDYNVTHGGTIGLQAEIRGTPTKVEWLREGRSITDINLNAKTFVEQGVYTLTLSNVTEKETGKYTCRAWSTHGNVDMDAAVTVIGPSDLKEGKPAVIVGRPEKKVLISVGEDLNISFRVQGEPKPKVYMMKGVRDISTSPRVCKMTSDDYVKFTLKRSVVSDAGTYCIYVKNIYGCDRAFVTLTVRQRASSENLISDWTYPSDEVPVTSTKNNKDVPERIPGEPSIVDAGNNWVSLSWSKSDSHKSAPVLAYKIESWQVGKEGGARWAEAGVTPLTSLDVYNLKQGAEYHFRVTPRNRYGWGEPVQTSTPVTCGATTGVRPEFEAVLPAQLKALVGDEVKLSCCVSGRPAPRVVWMKNGHEIEEEGRVQSARDGPHCTLTVSQVALEDEARYSCEATNASGRTSTYCRLAVVTDRLIWEADANLKRERSAESSGEFPPQLTMRLRDRRVQATYPVRLTCQAIGAPVPDVIWYKDGQQVKPDDRHTVSRDESFYTLEVTATRLEDGGVYEALARNSRGAVSCRCSLVVDKGIRAYIAPEFCCALPPALVAREGDEVRMCAVVEAYPAVGVVWYRDGVRLRPSRRAVMTLDRDGSAELALVAVAPRDSAVYTCTAANELGQATTSAKLRVLETDQALTPPPPQLNVPDVVGPTHVYSKEPMFIKKPRSSTAREGDTVIIECEVVGDPKPEVYWLRDFLKPEYYRDASHFHRVGDGPAYRCEIPHAKLDYTGTYSVLAKNCHGDAKAIISLQILAKDISADAECHNIKYGSVEVIPQFSRELKDLLCCDGDAVEFECQLTGHPEPDIVWYHYAQRISESDDFGMSWDGTSARLRIKQVTAEDEGTYTCEASNNLGKATCTACLVVYPAGEPNMLSQQLRRPPALLSAQSTPRSTPRCTPARSVSRTPGPDIRRRYSPCRQVAPKFYTYIHNKVVEEGACVRFQCAVTGHPAPWTTWDKDGVIVTPSARIRIKEKEDVRSLELEDVTVEDAGLYRITLENDCGRVEAIARLDVISHKGKYYTGVRAYSASPRRHVASPYSRHTTNTVSDSSHYQRTLGSYTYSQHGNKPHDSTENTTKFNMMNLDQHYGERVGKVKEEGSKTVVCKAGNSVTLQIACDENSVTEARTWFKNGEEIMFGDLKWERFSTKLRENVSYLTIKSVVDADEDVYTLVTNTRHGSQRDAVALSVYPASKDDREGFDDQAIDDQSIWRLEDKLLFYLRELDARESANDIDTSDATFQSARHDVTDDSALHRTVHNLYGKWQALVNSPSRA